MHCQTQTWVDGRRVLLLRASRCAGDTPDRVADIVGDQQRAVLADGDADGAALGLVVGADEAAEVNVADFVDPSPTEKFIVTLAVSAADVERIVFAQELGSVWLALESVDQSELTTGANGFNILQDFSDAPAVLVATEGSQP